MKIDSTTGMITWTPLFAMGPGWAAALGQRLVVNIWIGAVEAVYLNIYVPPLLKQLDRLATALDPDPRAATVEAVRDELHAFYVNAGWKLFGWNPLISAVGGLGATLLTSEWHLLDFYGLIGKTESTIAQVLPTFIAQLSPNQQQALHAAVGIDSSSRLDVDISETDIMIGLLTGQLDPAGDASLLASAVEYHKQGGILNDIQAGAYAVRFVRALGQYGSVSIEE